MQLTGAVKFWRIVKGDKDIVLAQFQLPSDVRQQVLNAYRNAGYEITEHEQQVPMRRGRG